MITPIREMTINQIMKRKDDLLVSGDDINEIAANVRNKVIDNMCEMLCEKGGSFTVIINGQKADILTLDYLTEFVFEIAEQLKDKTKL